MEHSGEAFLCTHAITSARLSISECRGHWAAIEFVQCIQWQIQRFRGSEIAMKVLIGAMDPLQDLARQQLSVVAAGEALRGPWRASEAELRALYNLCCEGGLDDCECGPGVNNLPADAAEAERIMEVIADKVSELDRQDSCAAIEFIRELQRELENLPGAYVALQTVSPDTIYALNWRNLSNDASNEERLRMGLLNVAFTTMQRVPFEANFHDEQAHRYRPETDHLPVETHA